MLQRPDSTLNTFGFGLDFGAHHSFPGNITSPARIERQDSHRDPANPHQISMRCLLYQDLVRTALFRSHIMREEQDEHTLSSIVSAPWQQGKHPVG